MPMSFPPRPAAHAPAHLSALLPAPRAPRAAFLRRRPLVRVRRAPRLLATLVLLAAVLAGALALLMAVAPAARAQPAPPFGAQAGLFAFGAGFAEPGSAASAGRALADRWLGDDVFDNPATPAERWRVEFTPVLLHSSRQDLRAANTDFDETSAFLDLGTVAMGAPLARFDRSRVDGWVYAARTLARSEENVFLAGRNLDPLTPSASVASETSVRETAIGASVGAGHDGFRAGVAGEWVMRDDDYLVETESGDPTSGARHTVFDGGAPAVRLGALWRSGEPGPGRWSAGVGLRWMGALEVEGTEETDLLVGAGTAGVRAERAAAWEGGLSLGWHAAEALHLFAGAGGRTEREWEGFGLTEDAAFEWSAAAEYREPSGPLSLRLGFGTESGGGAVDASRLGLGAGWNTGATVFEIGLLHRTLHRDDAPDAYEDRVVATVRWQM